MKIDDATGTDHIATVRVLRQSDGTGMHPLEVYKDDFCAATAYQDFRLQHTVPGDPGTFGVRYQVHWTDAGKLWVDNVRAHDLEIEPANGNTLRPPRSALLFWGDYDARISTDLASYYDKTVDPPCRSYCLARA